jgi:SAM-dependent methyltransferase
VDDTSCSPAADDPLLRLPFDQYQRYRTAVDVLDHIGLEGRVLEVGGAPGYLEEFLPGRDLVVTDVAGKRDGRYVMADGARLPFPDRSFPVVVTLDTLEHVPADRRPAFLEEARRVSGDLIVLCAPFRDPAVDLAEEALHAFVKLRFGTIFATLQEHHDHGLPDLDETVGRLAEGGWATAVLPSGYLPRWLCAMLVHHELAAVGLPDLPELHAYYNATVSPSDCRSPSYRHIVLAARDRGGDELQAALERLRADGNEEAARVTLASIASAVLATRLQTPPVDPEKEKLREYVTHLEGLRDDLARQAAEVERSRSHLEVRVQDLERQLADRDGHIIELRLLVERLRDERDETLERLLEAFRPRPRAGLLGSVDRWRHRKP